MKKIKLVLLLLMFIFPIIINADSCIDDNGNGKRGSVSLNTSSLTITEGKTATFKINASCAAGRVNIISSNTSVAKVSSSSEFVDNSSVTITITALKLSSRISLSMQ